MTVPLRVLILEDRPTDAELVIHELRRAGFEPDWRRVDSEADYLAHLDQAPDLILADYSLPQWDTPSALRALQGRGLDVPLS
jgi:pentatricopeptide repeat protein